MAEDKNDLGSGLTLALRYLPQASQPLTILLASILTVDAVLPAALAVAVGRLVAELTMQYNEPLRATTVELATVVIGLFVALRLADEWLLVIAGTLARRVNNLLRVEAVDVLARPVGIAHLEDPAVLDTVGMARNVGPGQLQPGIAVAGFTHALAGRLQAIIAIAVVGSIQWWLGLLLLLVWIQAELAVAALFFRVVGSLTSLGPSLLRAVYFRDLALGARAAKEVRVFSLRGWILERHRSAWQHGAAELWSARRLGRARALASAVGLAVGQLLVMAVGVRGVLHGSLSVGSFTTLLAATVLAGTIRLGHDEMEAAYGAAAVPALRTLALLDERTGLSRTDEVPADGLPRQAIVFEDVEFHYANAARSALDGLSLRIEQGTTVALVGANGAGKTTIVKLLSRLYDPTRGSISVDGIDLRDIRATAWQTNVAVLFQDFVRYQLTARENVVAGGGDFVGDEAAFQDALVRAKAAPFVRELPQGADTVLSTQFAGGADLSAGQWQRLALARALYAVQRGARVLVLDEPAAHLDARTEAQMYEELATLAPGATKVIISHRFSTVRGADKIIVIDDGRVVEEGRHDDLVAAGGRYAQMFDAQAAMFRRDAAAEPRTT